MSAKEVRVLAGCLSACAMFAMLEQASASTVTYTIATYIDGEDILYISGNTLQYQYLLFTPVGVARFDVPFTTTSVSTTLDANPVQSFNWQPIFASPTPSTGDFSSSYTGLNPAL